MIVYTKLELPEQIISVLMHIVVKCQFKRHSNSVLPSCHSDKISYFSFNLETMKFGTSVSFFFIIRFTCFLAGVLPVKKFKGINEAKLQSENSVNIYKISYQGLLLWMLLLIINCFIVSDHYKKFEIYANNHVQTCFQTNFCLSLVEHALITIHSVVPFFSIFYNFRLKLRCIGQAEYFYSLLATENFPKYPFYIFISFQSLDILSYIIKTKDIPFWYILLYCYCHIGVISLDCLIITFCYIIGKTYENINHEINSMIRLGNINKSQLVLLEKKHWENGNFLNDMNMCFGINLLFFWPYNIVHTITFLMFITDAQNHSIGVNIEVFHEIMKLLVFFMIVVCYGHIGTLLTKEAERTKVVIEKLRLTQKSKLDESVLKLIKIFKLKLHSRKILLTAAGFLKIDMILIQSFLGLILTYWIVLVQFRNND